MKTRDLVVLLVSGLVVSLVARWLFAGRAAVTVAGGNVVDKAWDEEEARALAEFQHIAGAGVGEDGVAANAGGVVAGVGK